MYITTAPFVTTVIVAAAWLTGSAIQPPPHSTHNPKHGGQFLLAANDTLHVEGVWPQQRVFKLFVYDASSRPLPPDRMRELRGYVEAAGQTAPLVLAADGSAFEARVPPLSPPAAITVSMALTRGVEAEGFSFIFPGFSDEHAPSFDLEPTLIPSSVRGLLAALGADGRDADRLVRRQETAYVFAPAVHARDHALALEPFLGRLPERRRPAAVAAIRTLVRTSWRLHIAGDDGTSEDVRAAAGALREAIDELVGAFGGGGR